MRLDQQLCMAHEPRSNWDYDGVEVIARPSVSSSGFDSKEADCLDLRMLCMQNVSKVGRFFKTPKV